MGQFNFECSKCGRHEQFDWTDAVVVGLRCNGTHGSEIIHVKGHYGSYGDVYIDLTHGKPAEYDVDGNLTSAADAEPSGSIAVYHKQFEGLFDFWERMQAQGAIHPHPHVAAETIYCFGGYCTTEYRPKPKAQSSTRRGRAMVGFGKKIDPDVTQDAKSHARSRSRSRSRSHDKEEEEEEQEEEEEEEVTVRGRRMCVPKGTIVYGQCPTDFAAKLPKWSKQKKGYVALGKNDLTRLLEYAYHSITRLIRSRASRR